MLKYSELSKAQKHVIDKMKTGVELQYNGDFFQFADGELVKASTENSLYLRHYIQECFHDSKNNLSVYCLNIDISYQ